MNFVTGGYINHTIPLFRWPTGCPIGTTDGITTCFCDKYCSWDVCRVHQPPEGCPLVHSWEWNPDQKYWFARTKGHEFWK